MTISEKLDAIQRHLTSLDDGLYNEHQAVVAIKQVFQIPTSEEFYQRFTGE